MEKAYAIVTGASGSMGREAVKALSLKGFPVVMACRNISKGESVRQSILSEVPGAELEVWQLELNSLDSIKAFADRFDNAQISHLFNNAGIINRSYSLSADGFESTRAVNYIGPYLLTRLLIPRMSPNAHIVNMVSLTCRFGKIGRNFFERTNFSQLGTYSDTKLALLLFSIELSRRYPQIVNVADPGVVNSNMISMGRWFDPLADLLFRPFCKRPESGVQPALNALETEERLHYFVGNNHFPVARKYLQNADVEWLWNRTEELLKQRGYSFNNQNKTVV